MRTPRAYAIQPEDDLSDKIVLSVRTKGFESQIEVPVPTTPGEIDKFVMSWLEMMAQGLKMPRIAAMRKQNHAMS